MGEERIQHLSLSPPATTTAQKLPARAEEGVTRSTVLETESLSCIAWKMGKKPFSSFLHDFCLTLCYSCFLFIAALLFSLSFSVSPCSETMLLRSSCVTAGLGFTFFPEFVRGNISLFLLIKMQKCERGLEGKFLIVSGFAGSRFSNFNEERIQFNERSRDLLLYNRYSLKKILLYISD